MRFIVFVKASRESESGGMPDKKDLMAMQNFNQKLVDAGLMLAGEGLMPSSKGARIDFKGGTPQVTEGAATLLTGERQRLTRVEQRGRRRRGIGQVA